MSVIENDYMSVRRYDLTSKGLRYRDPSTGKPCYEEVHSAIVAFDYKGEVHSTVWDGADEYAALHGAFARMFSPVLGGRPDQPVYPPAYTVKEKIQHVFDHFDILLQARQAEPSPPSQRKEAAAFPATQAAVNAL